MTNIIYLPGLGDGMDGWRKFALRGWSSSSRQVELVPMHWDDKQDTLDDKLARIEQAVGRADDRVVLVGESAGAPVALIALDRFGARVDQVITICGMNQHADQVRPGLYAKHPAFRDTMRRVDQIVSALDDAARQRIDIFYSRYDTTIDASHTLIDGVRAHPTHVPGHILAITCLITVLRGRIIAATARQ